MIKYGYRQVYPKDGFVNPTAKTELNHFLNYWLNNINTQGFEQENNPNKNTGRSYE